MSSDRAREIESWFYDHQDGEFVVAATEYRSSVVGGHATPRAVIYTTKVDCVAHHLEVMDLPNPVVIVGRYGLPVATDLVHLRPSSARTDRYFLGDADPPDILAFAWLREYAAIKWLGVSDELLNRNPLPDWASLEIEMSQTERQAVHAILHWCPDFRDLLGLHCSATLDRGFKIELEAAMIHLGSRPGR